MKEETTEGLLTLQIESMPDDVLIVRMAGEIDLSSTHILAGEFANLAAKRPTGMVLDATEVTFMDSTGLHALVEGKRILHDAGCQVFLVPSPQVRRVLELVFPEPLFAARVDTVDEALATFHVERGASEDGP